MYAMFGFHASSISRARFSWIFDAHGTGLDRLINPLTSSYHTCVYVCVYIYIFFRCNPNGFPGTNWDQGPNWFLWLVHCGTQNWSGWWFEARKIWVGMVLPNIWKNKKWQPNHQPVLYKIWVSWDDPSQYMEKTSSKQWFLWQETELDTQRDSLDSPILRHVMHLLQNSMRLALQAEVFMANLSNMIPTIQQVTSALKTNMIQYGLVHSYDVLWN